jgi:hypothetical protein
VSGRAGRRPPCGSPAPTGVERTFEGAGGEVVGWGLTATTPVRGGARRRGRRAVARPGGDAHPAVGRGADVRGGGRRAVVGGAPAVPADLRRRDPPVRHGRPRRGGVVLRDGAHRRGHGARSHRGRRGDPGRPALGAGAPVGRHDRPGRGAGPRRGLDHPPLGRRRRAGGGARHAAARVARRQRVPRRRGWRSFAETRSRTCSGWATSSIPRGAPRSCRSTGWARSRGPSTRSTSTRWTCCRTAASCCRPSTSTRWSGSGPTARSRGRWRGLRRHPRWAPRR